MPSAGQYLTDQPGDAVAGNNRLSPHMKAEGENYEKKLVFVPYRQDQPPGGGVYFQDAPLHIGASGNYGGPTQPANHGYFSQPNPQPGNFSSSVFDNPTATSHTSGRGQFHPMAAERVVDHSLSQNNPRSTQLDFMETPGFHDQGFPVSAFSGNPSLTASAPFSQPARYVKEEPSGDKYGASAQYHGGAISGIAMHSTEVSSRGPCTSLIEKEEQHVQPPGENSQFQGQFRGPTQAIPSSAQVQASARTLDRPVDTEVHKELLRRQIEATKAATAETLRNGTPSPLADVLPGRQCTSSPITYAVLPDLYSTQASSRAYNTPTTAQLLTGHGLPSSPHNRGSSWYQNSPGSAQTPSLSHGAVSRGPIHSSNRPFNSTALDSDDDEPLKSRVKPHPFALNRSSITNQVPSNDQDDSEDHYLDVEIIASRPTKKDSGALPGQETTVAQIVKTEGPKEDTDVQKFDFSLPKYDIERLPLGQNDDLETIRISLPGMPREDLWVSPDHAEQEVHLLLNVFMPNQKALTKPDPEPAVALLNFHTITLMVIEAFVQYEIGDLQALGRGHWHTEHDLADRDYDHVNDAKDADETEIFFDVTDRWRAARETKKDAVKYIRGHQEFCDVANDLIYYIKEHGLIREPKRRKRAPKKSNEDTKKAGTLAKSNAKGGAMSKAKGTGDDTEKKGTKRAAPKKGVNVLQGRKKQKEEAGVTVVKRK